MNGLPVFVYINMSKYAKSMVLKWKMSNTTKQKVCNSIYVEIRNKYWRKDENLQLAGVKGM